MCVLMYLLSSTADQYLSPSLEHITMKFKISESLAGVTLLALGNGAPDVFSSISAAKGSGPPKDDNVNLGDNMLSTCGLMGSALFISTTVIHLVLYS